jgi:hypothetical protein
MNSNVPALAWRLKPAKASHEKPGQARLFAWLSKACGPGFGFWKPQAMALSHIVWIFGWPLRATLFGVLAGLFKGHLILHDVVFTANIKRELNNLGDNFDDEKTYMEMVDEAEQFTWDQLVEDDEDDNSADDEMNGLVMELD